MNIFARLSDAAGWKLWGEFKYTLELEDSGLKVRMDWKKETFISQDSLNPAIFISTLVNPPPITRFFTC